MKLSKVAVLVSIACTPLANAEEVFTFDEVVVSATRTEQEVRDVAASVSTLSSDDMAKTMSSDLQHALKSQPGVSMEGQGRFGLSGFNIRGREDNYVKVLVDGVQQASIYNPGADQMRKYQGMFEMDTLTSVEINKGPVSSLYGSDALAGLVVMRTKNPSDFLAETGDDTYAGFSAGYTSANDAFKTTVTIANRTGDWESLIMYTKRDGHETQTHSSGADILGRERGQADPFDIKQDNFLGKLFYQVNDDHRIGFTAERFNRTAQGDLLHNEGYEMMPGYLYTQNRADDEDTRTRFSLEHEWQVNHKLVDDLEWLLAWQQSESFHKNYDHTPMMGYRNRERNGTDESTQFDVKLFKGFEKGNTYHEFSYGASYLVNQFELDYTNFMFKDGSVVDATPEVPNAKSKTWGIYAQDQIFLLDDQLVFTLGGRYDSFEARPNHGSQYPKASNDAFTGRVGAVYHWTDNFSTYGQISQGFKAPTIQDLYYEYSMGVELMPNPDLKAEESIAYEIGTRWAHRYGRLELSAFYNDYKNFIEDQNTGDLTEDGREIWTKVNVAKSRIYGAEFSTHTDLNRLVSAPAGTYFDFSLAYADGKDKETGDAIDSVAPLTSYFALGYDAPKGDWGSRVSVEAVQGKEGSDWSDADNLKAPGYAVTDITAYYKPSQAMTLRAGLFNAFDKKYWHYTDLSGADNETQGIDRRTQPGRNWGVEFDYEF
ncbi:TonB-dependent hemoglobin/transferrin/lactoferrin family receptor [Thaumasiovibrio subtropicus]|uniref:TonB-dependent hemoglobin/transferrin/lactoferrin family receptor n=1 Tax=Thaumasiovibrio subtropicus TaxID=1891207 RepID=UPI000B3544E4|nr:TonB-dependent hemoglobin/transferrin/lactoferrin family receptor [Thaumasiovibrio subtropicus]